jgi:hypothetical protein
MDNFSVHCTIISSNLDFKNTCTMNTKVIHDHQ